jgi:hypothetical protein
VNKTNAIKCCIIDAKHHLLKAEYDAFYNSDYTNVRRSVLNARKFIAATLKHLDEMEKERAQQ